jgi:GntR family transcriptional regulator/MocR family aminotransferase
MLIDPGEAAWMEDPGYFGARGALLGAEAQIVPVPVDREGLVVEAGFERAPTRGWRTSRHRTSSRLG